MENMYCHLVKCVIQTNYREHLKETEMTKKQWKYLWNKIGRTCTM